MRYLDLPGSPGGGSEGGGRPSVLGFGCAALLGRASRAESLSALAAAWDHGITFFDTARSYGYGGSEELLGGFLKGRRDRAVICTKFGILPVAQGGWKQRLKPVARAVVRAFPALRKAAQRGAASELSAGHFDVGTLMASFDTSLRQLGTDYVDMLLLHAAPASALQQDDLLEAMARLVESGKVRMAGVSGEQAVISQFFRDRPPPLSTAQFALNLENMAFVSETRLHSDPLLLVANHPYGGSGGNAVAKIGALRQAASLPPDLRQKLTLNDPQLLPELVLNCILDGTGIGAVVAAMIQVRHIAGNVRAIERCRFSAAELDLLRAALSSPAPRAS